MPSKKSNYKQKETTSTEPAKKDSNLAPEMALIQATSGPSPASKVSSQATEVPKEGHSKLMETVKSIEQRTPNKAPDSAEKTPQQHRPQEQPQPNSIKQAQPNKGDQVPGRQPDPKGQTDSPPASKPAPTKGKEEANPSSSVGAPSPAPQPAPPPTTTPKPVPAQPAPTVPAQIAPTVPTQSVSGPSTPISSSKMLAAEAVNLPAGLVAANFEAAFKSNRYVLELLKPAAETRHISYVRKPGGSYTEIKAVHKLVETLLQPGKPA